MSRRKRSASVNLTPNMAVMIKPVAPTMNNPLRSAHNAFNSVWNWCSNWILGPQAVMPMTYTEMTYTTKPIVAKTYIQTNHERIDDTTALKRQKTRAPHTMAIRSKSAVDVYRKGGAGEMTFDGCQTEDERRQRVDDYFRPATPPLLSRNHQRRKNKKTNGTAGLRLPTPESGSDRQDAAISTARRHSDTSLTPAYTSSDGLEKEQIRSFRVHHTPVQQVSPPATEPSSPRDEQTSKSRLDELLGESAEVEQGEEYKKFFRLSTRKQLERAELTKRREQEEKKAQLLEAKSRRLNRRKPKRQLVQPLSAKWEKSVNDAQLSKDQMRIVTNSMGGTELRIKDFKTLLNNGAWLNDEIINAYLEWTVDAANKAAMAEVTAQGEELSKTPKFIAHNSFFIEGIIKKGAGSTERLMKRKGAPGKSLMEVDSIFIPICKGSHWTIGVVRPIAKTIEYFDSMGGSGRSFIGLIRPWLRHQLGDMYEENEWTEPSTGCAHQSNGYDCGVFLCTNALCVTLGLDTSCYMEKDMKLQRRNIAAVLINKGFVGEFGWDPEIF